MTPTAAAVFGALLEVYTPTGAICWLRSRNLELDSKRPVDLLEEGKTAEVMEAIDRLRSGSFG